jgi:hypothetical protein
MIRATTAGLRVRPSHPLAHLVYYPHELYCPRDLLREPVRVPHAHRLCGMLLHVLEALGFTVTVLSARGRYQLPPQVRRPRTHVLLRFELDGQSYLVDGVRRAFTDRGRATSAERFPRNAARASPHRIRGRVAISPNDIARETYVSYSGLHRVECRDYQLP